MPEQFKYRSLADHAVIFPIGLGAMPLSIAGRPGEAEALQVVLSFLEAGGNFIDTADVYGLDDSDRGHSERLIRKSLSLHGEKHKILIASKGGASRPDGGWAFGGGQPKMLRQACENSLKNLGVESHALYYLHGPDKQVPLEESLGELSKLKEEGKIQHLGLANVTLEELRRALGLCALAAVQNRCNPFCKEDFNNGLIDFCKQNKLAYVPYCPLGGWGTAHARLAENAVLQELSEKYQVSTYPLVLAWHLQKAEHILPIPGMLTAEHVEINIAAVNLRLEDEDFQKIDAFPNSYNSKHIDN